MKFCFGDVVVMEDSKSVDDKGYTINGKSGVAEIVISFDKIPAHCGECRLYIENEYFDEDAFFWLRHNSQLPLWLSAIRMSCSATT